MKNIGVLVGLVSVLAACSHMGESYGNKLQQWVGSSEYQLYNSWGQPANVFYITPYRKVVTYVTTSSSGENNPYAQQLYYQGMGEDGGFLDRLFGPPGAESQPRIYYCKTMFTVQNGTVVNFSFSGDDCVYNN